MNKNSLIILSSFLLFILVGNSIYAAQQKDNHISINAEEQEGPNYKDLEITKSNGTYEVVGKAKVSKGVFYYMVENGHYVLVPEKKVDIHNLHWTAFKVKISIPKEKLPKSGALILYLYEKDKSGNPINQHPVVLEKF